MFSFHDRKGWFEKNRFFFLFDSYSCFNLLVSGLKSKQTHRVFYWHIYIAPKCIPYNSIDWVGFLQLHPPGDIIQCKNFLGPFLHFDNEEPVESKQYLQLSFRANWHTSLFGYSFYFQEYFDITIRIEVVLMMFVIYHVFFLQPKYQEDHHSLCLKSKLVF